MTTGADTTACNAPAAPISRLWRTAAVFGPGLLVMLADTDVGSVITAGQSGVQWGYRLLILQIVLVPVLFVVQELTVRLALVTRRGHGELISDYFGRFWALVSVSGLAIACAGALLTEFSGVAGVGEIYGIPRAVSLALAAVALLTVVLTGSYRRVEGIAIGVGLFEFAFFFVAYYAHPAPAEVGRQMIDLPVANKDFLYLAAANIGAVIMPWMVFYQQSALADKRLGPEHLTVSRIDTALGALVTQLVMAAVLVACAATIGHSRPDATLATVGDMSQALTPFLGETVGRVVFSLGVLGAGMVAAIVVSLALAWGVGEVTGYSRSLEMHPLRARWFYGVYCLAVIAGAALVWAWPDLVQMNIAVQVMNALLLPLVIGFLVALAVKALPEEHRLKGPYLWFVVAVSAATTALGVFGGLQGAGLF